MEGQEQVLSTDMTSADKLEEVRKVLQEKGELTITDLHRLYGTGTFWLYAEDRNGRHEPVARLRTAQLGRMQTTLMLSLDDIEPPMTAAAKAAQINRGIEAAQSETILEHD